MPSLSILLSSLLCFLCCDILFYDACSSIVVTGNASLGGGEISVAKVSAKKGFEEDWQCPEFDEYVVVLKGSIVIGECAFIR